MKAAILFTQPVDDDALRHQFVAPLWLAVRRWVAVADIDDVALGTVAEFSKCCAARRARRQLRSAYEVRGASASFSAKRRAVVTLSMTVQSITTIW